MWRPLWERLWWRPTASASALCELPCITSFASCHSSAASKTAQQVSTLDAAAPSSASCVASDAPQHHCNSVRFMCHF